MRLRYVSSFVGWVFLIVGTVGALILHYLALTLLAIGIVLLAYDTLKRVQLKNLKANGIHYNAEIVYMVKTASKRAAPMRGAIVRIGFMTDTYVKCRYTNEYGVEFDVTSRMFLWDSPEHYELKAYVYVDRDNPEKYAVEVTKR